VVIGWRVSELTNLEAKPCEDVRRFRKAKPFWRPNDFCRGHPDSVMRSLAFGQPPKQSRKTVEQPLVDSVHPFAGLSIRAGGKQTRRNWGRGIVPSAALPAIHETAS
jgi:hypothetical protein